MGCSAGGEEPGEFSSQMIFYARNSFISAVSRFLPALCLTSPDLDMHLNFRRHEGQTKIDSQQLMKLPLAQVSNFNVF